jgi:TPR repeat protein
MRAIHFASDSDCDGSEIESLVRAGLVDYIEIPEFRDLPVTVLYRIVRFDDQLCSDHFHQLFDFCVDVFHRCGPAATVLFAGLDARLLTAREVQTLHGLSGFCWDLFVRCSENGQSILPSPDRFPRPSPEEEAAQARLAELQAQISRNELYLRAQEAALFLCEMPSVSLALLKLAADLGDPTACLAYAQRIAAENRVASVRYLRRAAARKDALSQFLLGKALIPFERDEARLLLCRSAEQGNAAAMIELGELRSFFRSPFAWVGSGFSSASCWRYLVKAADLGELLGMVHCMEALSRWTPSYRPPSIAQFQDWADRGTAAHKAHFGRGLALGKLNRRDGKTALTYFRKWFEEARLLDRGFAVPAGDEATQIEGYLKMFADVGSGADKREYGLLLAAGHYVRRDLASAREYLKQSAETGNARDKGEYGILLGYGLVVAQDLEAAERYFKAAADEGGGSYMRIYADRLFQGSGERGIQGTGESMASV